MTITEAKISNPYNITYNLSSDGSIIEGDISIDGKQYHLPILTRDILDLLAKMTDKHLLDSLITDRVTVPPSVDHLSWTDNLLFLEVKLRLMARDNFQEMSNTSKAKFKAIKEYYNMKDDENIRHNRNLEDINKWLDEQLAALENECKQD
jgi:hypothetical protein